MKKWIKILLVTLGILGSTRRHDDSAVASHRKKLP